MKIVGEREKATVFDKGNGNYIVEYTARYAVPHNMTVTFNGTLITLPYEKVHIFEGRRSRRYSS